MSAEVNLGTIFAGVELRLGNLKAGVSQVTSSVATIKKELGAAEQAGTKAGAGMSGGLKVATGALMNISAVITGVAANAVKMSADFETSLTNVRNNTTMTAKDFGVMKDAVVSLGKESGAPLDQLSEGFMHVTNFGFKASDSVGILREAMKSAVATGSNTADTADILAKSLHEFGLSATDAGKAMNVMHLAAAQGNMTLEQFDVAAGPAFAVAANLGVKLQDVSAAMSALTRHGLDAAEAATQVKDILQHIIAPSHQAKEELAALSKTSGIDLVADFSQAGLKAKGLAGVMDDVKRAAKGNGEEIYKLIEAQRGGIGAMILAGSGANDYKEILGSLSDAMSGKIDPTTEAYNRTLQTLNNEIARITNEIKTDFVPAGEKVTPVFEAAIPAIRETAHLLSELLDLFAQLPKPIQEVVVGLGALKLGAGAAGLVFGDLKKMIGLAGAEQVGFSKGGIAAFSKGGPYLIALAAVAAAILLIKQRFDEAQHTEDVFSKSLDKIPEKSGKITEAAELRAEAARLSSDINSRIQMQRNLHLPEGHGEFDPLGLGKAYQSQLVEMENRRRYALDRAAQLERQANGPDAGASGGSKLAEAMAKHIGEATGIQCGAAVSKALKESGLTGTATALAKAAIAHKDQQLHPDANGFLPPGTIVYFPDKQHSGSVSGSGQQHFAVAGGLNDQDQQVMVESTTAGGKGRHYRGDRTLAQIAAEHGGQYYAFAAPGDSGGSALTPSGATSGGGGDASDLTDLMARAIGAKNGKYAQERYEAQQTYKKDKETDPRLAAIVYKKALADIHQEELDDLKQHHAKVETEQQRHAVKIMSIITDSIKGINKATKSNAGDIFGNPDAAKPISFDLSKFMGGLNKTVKGNVGAIQTNEIADAQDEISTQNDDIKEQKAQAKELADYERELARATAEAQREEWRNNRSEAHLYFDSLRQEAAAEAASYIEGLKARGVEEADAKAQANALYQVKMRGIDAEETAAAKEEWDRKAKPMEQAMQSGLSKILGHWRNMKTGIASIMDDIKSYVISTITQIAAKWAVLHLLGGPKVTGGGAGALAGLGALSAGVSGASSGLGLNIPSFGGSAGIPSTPGIAPGGNPLGGQLGAAAAVAGATGQGGAAGAIGTAASLASLLGKGGVLGHLFAHGGMMAAGGPLMAALPWVAGGLAINSLLGNPLKKIFHFSKGGTVPGVGFRDTVPAMLTPGEKVIPRGMSEGGGHPPITVNHFGDIHDADGARAMYDNAGWLIQQRLAVATDS
ncbi:hypothetical protein CCAX7_000340 [Capsulimonas corticalis]|uniref:Phage tail tape measure protein domain-containing protein n=1 Tax=Capsulimonas corticalis TaxID=2219043 RepID=A0A402CRD8_9BACT|nr:phage tail tape measure protein [Capsulimonas corticalis]BDI27983.1 hypothetical protein CCAX7_000340 [Capsulimonas corticalis]